MLLNDTGFISLPLFTKGKVRNVYDLGDKLLFICTDRISAFDVIFPDLIPNKGAVLNSISEFWFNFTSDFIPNHMISTDVSNYPAGLSKFQAELAGRSMLVKKVRMVEAECVVRGYLEGSALKEYNRTGVVSGIRLAAGLKQCDKLPEPLFTPSTKAKEGHDENITFDQLVDSIGMELASELREKSIGLYMKASKHAESKGLILADSKYEFGMAGDQLIVADELFTPDSSRFWDASQYQPGRPQKSFDKQFLREYLETLDWDKKPPAPKLPEEIVRLTAEKYLEAYELITGKKLIVA